MELAAELLGRTKVDVGGCDQWNSWRAKSVLNSALGVDEVRVRHGTGSVGLGT